MTDEEIFKIVRANATNKFIFEHLDEKTSDLVLSMLEKLDAKQFKEINPNGSFVFDDLPIPYEKLSKSNGNEETAFSTEIQTKLEELTKLINNKGTNFEYSFAFAGRENQDETYSQMKEMGKEKQQTCSYDWEWIEDYIKRCPENINLAIFHTHPNPLGTSFKTLYNENTEILSDFGVKPDGLNLSLADVYATMYLDNLAKKHNKKINTEAMVLLHNGTLLTFSTANGVQLRSDKVLSLKQKEDIATL